MVVEKAAEATVGEARVPWALRGGVLAAHLDTDAALHRHPRRPLSVWLAHSRLVPLPQRLELDTALPPNRSYIR